MYDTCIFDLYGTLVDIRTDENKEELWEKLSLFYAFYGAFYTPEELARSYKRLTGEMTAGHEELRRDSHEAFPEIRIEEVFHALFEEKGIAPDEPLVRHAGQFFRILSMEFIRLYDGTEEMLSAVKESGRKIALATSKPLVFAKRILKHYDLERYFDVVMGAELSGVRNNKDEVIAEVLRLFGNPDPQDVLMVGDRKQDIIGAASVGARFGYAEPNELEAEEPDYIVDTVEELEELILGGN